MRISFHRILEDNKGNRKVVGIPEEEGVLKDTIPIRFGKFRIPPSIVKSAPYLYATFRYSVDGKEWYHVPEDVLTQEALTEESFVQDADPADVNDSDALDDEGTQDVDDAGQESKEGSYPRNKARFVSLVYQNPSPECSTGDAQALTASQIHELKAKGIEAKDLIEILTQNSRTFGDKTQFSKAKYIKKKKAKHLAQFSVLPITLMDIAETHFNGDFKRIGLDFWCRQTRRERETEEPPVVREKHILMGAGKVFEDGTVFTAVKADVCEGLRFDYLSALLCYGNVRPGARVLAIDQSGGLLTAGVAQRLGGSGTVYRASGRALVDTIVHEMDFSNDVLQCIRAVSFTKLMELSRNTRGSNTQQSVFLKQDKTYQADEQPDSERVPAGARHEATVTPAATRELLNAEALDDLLKEGVDSLVVSLSPGNRPMEVSTTVARLAVFRLANRLLVPGGHLAFFSLSHSHAAALQLQLMRSGLYTGIRFEELFLREYQVLPSRTHPLMAPEARLFSGFLLYAIKVLGGQNQK